MDGTILFADLAGFTALTEAHGDEDAADLAERFYALARTALEGEARLVKTIGDAVLVVGDTSSRVMSATLRLVQAAESEPGFPALRAGLHAGPVTERGGDVFGATVNVAARVAAHARAGQILCTAPVAKAIAGLDHLRLQSIGAVQFKNVVEAVELFELVYGDDPPGRDVVDPVCRMRVDPAKARARLEIDGQTFFFCSSTCEQAFARAPVSYRRG